MNRLFLLLFGLATFVAHAQDTLLVEEFTMTFSSYFEHETQVLESGESYFMTIDGQYNISSGTYGHKDAAWYFCYASCSEGCNSNTPCPSLDEDNWNASITSLRPDVDVYDPNHHYEYSIVGEGASMVFDFNDSAFGDNGGALVIAIYAIVNQIEGCTDPTACNFNAEATSEDGSCTYPPFGLTDCEAGGALCGEGTIWDASLQACLGFNDCPSDLDGDGIVGVNDLLVLLSDFGTVCPAEVAEWTCGDPVSYHSHDYATVQIGEQCWFAENLRTELYQNGDSIPMIYENAAWLETEEGALCWHNNDSTSWGFPGFLYNGYSVADERGVCPNSWHVATDADWIVVEISHGLSESEAQEYGQRGGSINLSQKMRDESWGQNELGFAARRGGYRSWENGSFSGPLQSGAFWSNSDSTTGYREFYSQWSGVARGEIGVSEGLSVRCLKDTE